MMLSADDLKEALQNAVKAGETCGRYCTYGSRIEGGAYHTWHNGVGRDTDAQPIYAPGILNLSKDGLTEKLRAWIVDLHSGNRIDLNATMATGGPARSFALVGERGSAVWTTCFNHSHLHLHVEGSCSTGS